MGRIPTNMAQKETEELRAVLKFRGDTLRHKKQEGVANIRRKDIVDKPNSEKHCLNSTIIPVVGRKIYYHAYGVCLV